MPVMLDFGKLLLRPGVESRRSAHAPETLRAQTGRRSINHERTVAARRAASLPAWSVRSDVRIRVTEVAFPEVERNFVERALLPFFGLGQPETLALTVQHRALAADVFLAANFDEPLHELHSCGVKPIRQGPYEPV
jgi:hypothetical protein